MCGVCWRKRACIKLCFFTCCGNLFWFVEPYAQTWQKFTHRLCVLTKTCAISFFLFACINKYSNENIIYINVWILRIRDGHGVYRRTKLNVEDKWFIVECYLFSKKKIFSSKHNSDIFEKWDFSTGFPNLQNFNSSFVQKKKEKIISHFKACKKSRQYQ